MLLRSRRALVGNAIAASRLRSSWPSVGQDRGPEPRDQLGERGLPRRDHLAGELVGVDDGGTARDQQLRHRALARGNATRQPDHVRRHAV